MRKTLVSVITLVACGACTSSYIPSPPINGGGHENGAGNEGVPPSTTTTYAVLVGGTVPIAPGTQAGYALTSASALKTYQLRWTGDAAVAGDGYKEFYGSAWRTGHFTFLTPGCVNSACPLESGDVVSGVETVTGGERIDWDTFASDGWDGFGFTTDTEPVYFDVYIDGNRLPQLVSFPVGSNAAPSSPASSPFGVTSAK